MNSCRSIARLLHRGGERVLPVLRRTDINNDTQAAVGTIQLDGHPEKYVPRIYIYIYIYHI